MEIIQIITNVFLIFLLIFSFGSILSLPFQLSEKVIPCRVFYKLSLGVVGLIFFTSIYYTSFKTINILLLPIIFLFFYKKRTDLFRNVKLDVALMLSELKYIVTCLFVLIVFVCVQFYRFDYFNDTITYLPQADYSYYLTIGEYLFESGVERFAPWYELNELSNTGKLEPYHYGDIWFLGIVNRLSNLSSSVDYLYVFLPICATISFAGLHSLLLISSQKTDSISFKLICFLMIFSLGSIPFVREAFGFEQSPITSPKVFLFFIFVIVGFNFLLEKKIEHFITVIACIPIFHIIYAPTIYTALFLWSVFLFLKNKEKRFLLGIIFPMIFTLSIILFYFLLGEFSSFFRIGSEPTSNRFALDFFTATIRGIVVRFLVFYPILVFLFFLFLKKKNQLSTTSKYVFTFSLILLLCAILFRGLMTYNLESNQIYNLIYNPIATILYVFLFSLLLRKEGVSRKWLRVVYFLIIFQGVSSSYIVLNTFNQREFFISKSITQELRMELKNKNPIGVFINSPDSWNYYNVSASYCTFANPLKILGENMWVNSISVPENIEEFPFPQRVSDVMSSPFFKFIQKEKTAGTFINYQKSQIDFIKKYKVDFVILEEGATFPNELKVLKKKLIEDSQSGFRIAIFENLDKNE